ncbi:MAG: efflux RND transporter periplasmic adaptor subunit [Polyangiaceae bacterium]
MDTMKPRRRWVGWLLVGSVLLGAPIVGILTAPKREAIAGTIRPAESTPAVTSTAARPAPRGFAGVLLPPQMATLSAYADGRVERIAVKVGQRVKAGDLLLTFDPREAKEALEAAENAYQAARAAAGAAGSDSLAAAAEAKRNGGFVEHDGKRYSLVAEGQAAQSRFNASAAAGRAASAAAAAAEAKSRVGQLKLALEHSEFRAPFDGMVTQISVESGATAHGGQPVVRVVGGDGLRVRLAVPEITDAKWREQKHAAIEVDNRVYHATIDQAAPEVEPASRTYFVEGPVDDAAGCGADCALLAGRPVRVVLTP